MKKIVLTAALICFFLGVYTVSSAQMVNSAFVSMQHLGTDRAGVRAFKEFIRKHGENRDEKWYKLSAGYLAEFTEGPIQDKAVFDRTGSWLYSIREYTEQELPKDVRTLVKSSYYDFSIGWVKEVSQYQALTYVIHIANGSEWKDLLVQDGEIGIQHEVTR